MSSIRRLRPYLTAAVLVLSLGVEPAAAWAQAAPPDEAAVARAREQFAQALSLQTAGDWAGALALLQQVARIKPTPQVRFNIALCEENLGRLVSAVGDYELAAADAREANAENVAREVDARLESLKARIPKIVVQRGDGAETATIVVDGVVLGDAVIGKPMPADPGPHLIEATAKGYEPFQASVRLSEQQVETVVVTLSREAVLPPVTPPPPAATEESAPPLRTVGYVTAGVGAASLIASGVFFYLREQSIDELDQRCPDMVCPTTERNAVDQGRTYNTLANVTLALGAVGLAAGIPMILIGSSDTSDRQGSLRLLPGAAGAPGGASLYGRF